ncbi:MAG: response regulator, partial [Planctomycetes bacterium]|nr:response regulator [Planctomycetota bacterium]
GYTPPSQTAPLPQNPVESPPPPRIRKPESAGARPAAGEPDLTSTAPRELPDDRDDIQPGDHVVLIVEDDVQFAKILMDMAHDKGFKRLVATRGDAGLALARKYKPDAITLDIRLPEMDGWRVLDQLKHDLATRHIPVHMMSVEDGRQRALEQGAIAYLEKPVDKAALAEAFADIGEFVKERVRKLLIVEDNEAQRKAIAELIGNGDVETTAVGTGQAALEAMKTQAFDCLILDLGLPDMSGFDLIEAIKQAPDIREVPVIVYTGKELTEQEETRLKRVSESIVVKDVKSPERLLDETALFLHRIEEKLPEPKRKMLRQVHQQDPALAGKKTLIVDDDVRNIFALTSVLERQKMEVVYAETGQAGLQMLEDTPDIDVVLMDIMMPGMDGYAAMRAIRKMPQFKKLPIIAVTAKAMKGDREKCIEAGASDYIMKPVDNEQLLSLLRVWTYG